METRRHSAPPDLPPDCRRNPPLPPAWPWPYQKHKSWRAWAGACWRPFGRHLCYHRNLHLIAIALLLACSALGGWLHGGIDGYLVQPPPPFYADYASRYCALLAVRQLHYPDFHRALFPAPLQDSLRFLSVSHGTARSEAKHFLPCFGPDKCKRNLGLNSTECVAIIAIADDAAAKLRLVLQYPPTILDTNGDQVVPEESSVWQHYFTLEQVRRPRYYEHGKANASNKNSKQPCQCTVGRAVYDAFYQVATRHYSPVPATLIDAASQGWCPCDITSAFEPYDYVLTTTIPDFVTSFVTHIVTDPFSINTTWPSLTFRPARLPPRRIDAFWFIDTVWHVQRPTWSSSPSIASFAWGHMAAVAQQRFVNRLREWGRDGLERPLIYWGEKANLTAEERAYLLKMGWIH